MTEHFSELEQLIALNPAWRKADFFQRSQQIALQLQQDNIQSVGLWLEDACDFACVLLACLNVNVRVLLPPNVLAENQQWVMENTDLFFQNDQIKHYGISQIIDQIQPLIDKNSTSEIWLKTSGSSGEAKVISKTATQMWKEAETLAQILPFERGSRVQVLGSVSVQHLYGLTFRIFVALEMGWLLGREQWQYPEYLIAQSKMQRSIWISSPALLNHLHFDNDELARLSLIGIVSAGSALPQETTRKLRDNMVCPVCEIYGSTETGVIAFRQQSEFWQIVPDSQIGVNEQGALWVENLWTHGREQTADAVEICPQGFQLLGRVDRIVKLGDKRVSLVKMEQTLLQHSWVVDSYIALHPQYARPVAWLVLNSEGQAALSEKGRSEVINTLKGFLLKTQEKFALPRYWRFSERLPRNSQSKINQSDFEQICQEKQK